ncbi:polyprenyl synthetase family protein [Paenibacillus sp. KQZ6P-2]|uniref:Polyprenyl synthetase family protein n=1 Tax=Paenibacillus mangrovi TaxID=2931978 RepID=A0A9X1WRY8_9BACL|nr:polyprenyl synthetase family protein [Paenibacillus mangrovi]MCJ8014187.1 polyprenyl synthetase family protein [Paenibacillus mangrovi]
MNTHYINHAGPDASYRLAEEKAAQYFSTLNAQVKNQSFLPILTNDIQLWKRNHISKPSLLSLFSKKKKGPDSRDYGRYIQWLNYTGKLDDYLDRSVSYIYMRDLGKALDSPETKNRIQRIVADVKRYVLQLKAGESDKLPATLDLAELYRGSQKLGIEASTIWLIDKLRGVAAHIPEGMSAEHAERKLLKIIIGVMMHVYEELDADVSPSVRAQKLSEAIRLGYSYGLTYPFIDDLLDSHVLTPEEKEQYSHMIRSALLTGIVPEIKLWTGSNQELIQYIHAELKEAFETIENIQSEESRQVFFEQSYVFFQSQEQDRAKSLAYASYTNEELYIPVILKSSSSRQVVRSVIAASVDDGFDHRTFYYGLYNQLADDFADMFDDMNHGAVTPYTYYLKYRHQRPDLMNPFELYWAVIHHLIHGVHHSDSSTREVILDRAINGLKRCKERVGTEKYNEIMDIFASGIPTFNKLVQQMVWKANDVDFFDKLLRDQLVTALRNNQREKEEFFNTIDKARDQINSVLKIPKEDGISPMKEPLIDAANYSLEGDGKRLRPILSWTIAVNTFGLNASEIVPLLRSIEYMHTASLIFDDLPSQDNASIRRGRPTLHQVHNIATAELTGLLLIQRAIKEQSSLKSFDPKAVLALMQYSAHKTEEMCMGQAMDLDSKGKVLNLDQLNMICFYKTGVAFEASLVMPAILAQIPEKEIETLKKYAYHAGIAFQIKDDLLDLEGDTHVLGKPVGQDAQNNNSNFVSILGQGGARKEMWEHYCLAMEALKDLPRNIAFLRHLLNYFVNRDR